MTPSETELALPPRRAHAGFFSSARSFLLGVGRHIEPGAVRGYYIDLSVKASTPRWPPYWPEGPGEHLYVDVAQRGLGCYERYLTGDGDEWLAGALDFADRLVRQQQRGGRHDGGWVHRVPFPHTFELRPPWLSSMAQGEGASLLVRAHRETGDDRFAEAALRALAPLSVSSDEGGVAAWLDGGWFPEEFPTQPPSFVLNGAIFTVWGLYDVATGLGDGGARSAFEGGLETLAATIERWDTGYWSRYDLFPHPLLNVASSAYHALHVNQLRAMETVAPRDELRSARERFEGYAASPLNRARAFARKALFRLVVPRSERAQRWLPWARTPVR